MKGAVVYHTKWGNCRQVAEAIAGGLAESGIAVTLLDLESGADLESKLSFLVLGSPTRVGKATGPARRFAKRKLGKSWLGKPFAAFGTGIADRGEKEEPKGADDLDRRLSQAGLVRLLPPFKARVTGMKGPLAEGELERAARFGRDLARALREPK